MIVLIDQNYETNIAVNNYCRKNNIKFIGTDVYGPWTRLFNDFGQKFEVIDKNGEDPQEVMISKISCEEKGIVTLLQGAKHTFEDGEKVVFKGVDGMELINGKEGESING